MDDREQKPTKRIAMLTCLNATEVCSGAACFKALNERKATFGVYEEMPVEVVAFFHCNGCDADYDHNDAFMEKMERVCSMKPDAIHVGICTKKDGVRCPVIEEMIAYFETDNIKIVYGTH